MKTKIFILTLLMLCLLFSPYQMAKADVKTVDTIAVGMAVIEGNTNTLLYEKNSSIQLPMASTTKIVTCIVAVENYLDIDSNVLVNDKAVGIDGTSIYLKHGEVIKFKDLLYGLMLASGNDCAVAIAEEVCGVDEFVNKMNEFAIKCGANNTHFSNPHGLDAEGHYTTAYDLALMTSYALKNTTFREIVATKNYIIPETNAYQKRYLRHKNRLMFIDEDCIGVKTGFTDNAKRCLVNATERDDMQIISVVLNCQPMFEECLRLDAMAYGEYEMKDFVNPYTYVGNVCIEDGDKEELGVATLEGFKKVIKIEEEDDYEVIYDIPKMISAPIKLNEPIGHVKVLYKGEPIYTGTLYTIDETKNINLKYKIDEILEKWFIS